MQYVVFCMLKKIHLCIIYILLSLLYAYQTLHRIITTFIGDHLIYEHHLTAHQLGCFAGSFYIGYVLMHIPMGIFLDCCNVKRVMSLCVFFMVVGFLPMIYSDNFIYTVIGRVLIGAGSSAITLGAFKLFLMFFGRNRFIVMLGIMATLGLVIVIWGTKPIQLLIHKYSLVTIMYWFLFLGLLLLLLVLVFIPNTQSSSDFSSLVILDNLRFIVSKPLILFIGYLGGMMIGPLEGYADAWSIKYLEYIYDIDKYLAADINNCLFLGTSLGLVCISRILRKIRSHYFLLILCASVMLLCFLGLLARLKNLWVIYFSIGFFSSYQIVVIDKIVSLVPKSKSVFSSAVANMVMMGCGSLFHILIGEIIAKFSVMSYTDINFHVWYSTIGFTYALLPIIICLFVAVFGFYICKLVDR